LAWLAGDDCGADDRVFFTVTRGSRGSLSTNEGQCHWGFTTARGAGGPGRAQGRRFGGSPKCSTGFGSEPTVTDREALVNLIRIAAGVLLPAAALSCAAPAPHSTMLLEQRGSPLALEGPDAYALPLSDRYRYGVVVGSVLTSTGERGCNGDAWLQPWKAPVVDVRPIGAARLLNMFRFPQLLPGSYVLGVRCMGFQPVRRRVDVRVGHVVRAVVTMRPQPLNLQ
jgi:hypothetical protein